MIPSDPHYDRLMLGRKPAGRTRVALARRLQKDFPTHNGRELLWIPEHIHAAKGFYRTSSSWNNFASRWEAFAHWPDTGNLALTVQSTFTMTQCLRAALLSLDSEGYVDVVGPK